MALGGWRSALRLALLGWLVLPAMGLDWVVASLYNGTDSCDANLLVENYQLNDPVDICSGWRRSYHVINSSSLYEVLWQDESCTSVLKSPMTNRTMEGISFSKSKYTLGECSTLDRGSRYVGQIWSVKHLDWREDIFFFLSLTFLLKQTCVSVPSSICSTRNPSCQA